MALCSGLVLLCAPGNAQQKRRLRAVTWYAAETRVKTHFVVRQFKITHRTGGNVQNDLSVTRVFHRHIHARQHDIYHQVRRQLVVQQPLIECTQQVRAARRKLRNFHSINPGQGAFRARLPLRRRGKSHVRRRASYSLSALSRLHRSAQCPLPADATAAAPGSSRQC